jgi:hypothetical protein
MSAKPPAMFRVNGVGTFVYGKRDLDPKTGSHVTTYVFTIVFIPVFCFAAYRVIDGLEAGSLCGTAGTSLNAGPSRASPFSGMA